MPSAHPLIPETDAAAADRARAGAGATFRPAVLDEAVQDHRYAPYVARQDEEIARLRSDEAVRLPAALDYAAIAGPLERDGRAAGLGAPATLGAASRIRGVTPAALAAILVHARRKAA